MNNSTSTPTRPRVLPPHLRPTTPSSSRKPTASASPQVKEALAALRRQRAAQNQLKPPSAPTSLSGGSGSSTPTNEQQDPFATPARRPTTTSSRASSALSQNQPQRASDEEEEGPGPDSVPGLEGAEDESDEARDERLAAEWGIKSSLQMIEQARKAGRLNLSSRELRRVPPALWTLLPRSSLHHPSHAAPSSSRAQQVNLTIGGADGEGREGTYWYDEVDLKTLALANNELTEVGDALGDFDVLDTLDLHANLLKTVPLSFCGLSTLTTLNLSQNPLTAFPLVLLSLNALTELNLSSCALTHLWPTTNWREELAECLRPVDGPSPSATPESANVSRDFIEMFPSSPTKASAAGARFDDSPQYLNARKSMTPWPRLKTLELRDNKLDWNALSEVEWPANLVSLDLSSCGLRDQAINPHRLGKLGRLEVLDLAKNYLADGLFGCHSSLQGDGEAVEGALFGCLRSLELELNSIDSCATLEQWLHSHVRRPIEWTGVEKKVQNLIASAKHLPGAVVFEGVSLEVKVADNPLREEQVRRRAMFPPRAGSASSSPALGPPAQQQQQQQQTHSATASPVMDEPDAFEERKERVKEQWELDAEAGLLTEGGRRKARILAARKAQEEADAQRRSEQAEQALSNGLAKLVFKPREEEKEKEVVVERVVEEQPAPPTEPTPEPSPPPKPAPTQVTAVPAPALVSEANDEALKADPAIKLVKSALSSRSPSLSLAHKSLAEFPVPAHVPSHALVPPPHNVNLSHNILSTTPFAALVTSWGWAHTLRTLDLSANQIAVVEVLQANVVLHALVELNLAQNRFRGDSAQLLERLAAAAPSLETLDLSRNSITTITNADKLLLPAAPRQGLKKLILRNNKIEALTPLADLAERMHNNAGDVERWRCELIDVQENEVARLDPKLGWLPAGVSLLVGGNRFRVPRREVYEAGGGRELLAWLRERI